MKSESEIQDRISELGTLIQEQQGKIADEVEINIKIRKLRNPRNTDYVISLKLELDGYLEEQ